MRIRALLFWLLLSAPLLAQPSPVTGYCNLGAAHAAVSGLNATNWQQGIIPGCTVSVYNHGTQNLSTIFSDSNSTPLANPFTANVAGSPDAGAWIFWAGAGGSCYDVVGSGGTAPNVYPAPVTLTEVCLETSGGGAAISITATLPIVVTPNPITGTGDISCPTCGTGGQVSAEYLQPLYRTNAPAPTTTSDIIFTPFNQGESTQLMGPPPGTVPGAFVYQFNSCNNNTSPSSTASCSFLGPSLPGHAYYAAIVANGSATVSPPTTTNSDVYTNIINGGTNGHRDRAGYFKNVCGNLPACATNGAVTISAGLSATVNWSMVIVEIGDTSTTVPVDTDATNTGGGCVGTTLTFPSVITGAGSLIVASNFGYGAGATPGYSTYYAGTGYVMKGQAKQNDGGLFPGMSVMVMAGFQGAGTIAPTATVDANCNDSDTATVAFHSQSNLDWAQPTMRYPLITDLVQQGWFPDPSGSTGFCLSTDGLANGGASLSWKACGASSPGGGDKQVQYDNGGAFGGISGVKTDGVSLNVGSGSAAYTHLSGTDGTITTYQSDHTTVAAPYLVGDDGSSDSPCGAGFVGFYEAADHVMHECKAAADLGTLPTTNTTPVVNTVACIKAVGPPVVIGYCADAAAGGPPPVCTCQ